MSKSPLGTICPLLSIGSMASSKTTTFCKKDMCDWWSEYDQSCIMWGIVALEPAIVDMTLALQEIDKKRP